MLESWKHKHGKYLNLQNLHFEYGHEAIVNALKENFKRTELKRAPNQVIYPNRFKDYGIAISYRFIKDKKGWRVFVTVEQQIKMTIDDKLGAIGIDINEHHLAVCEVNASGNWLKAFNVPCSTYGEVNLAEDF